MENFFITLSAAAPIKAGNVPRQPYGLQGAPARERNCRSRSTGEIVASFGRMEDLGDDHKDSEGEEEAGCGDSDGEESSTQVSLRGGGDGNV